MCSIQAIRIFTSVLVWLKAIFLLYTFAIGIFLASSFTLQQAFGVEFLSYGLSLIFIALLGFAIIYPFKYGIDRHNRFVILFVFCLETIVFAEMINYGLVLQSYTVSDFSKGLQKDCSQNVPSIYSSDRCNAFYDADRTAGFRLVWTYFFSKSRNKFNFQTLSLIQDSGNCCGFFPPQNCRANEGGFPSNRDTAGIAAQFLKQRVTCADYPQYYPEQYNCADVVDYSTNPPTIGGCRYDLGVSFCLENAIASDSMGCASYMEDYVVGLISPHAPVLMGLSTFSFIFLLLCACMWWKRKETDVFPDFLDVNADLKERNKPESEKEKERKEKAAKDKEGKDDIDASARAVLNDAAALRGPDPNKLIAIEDVVYHEVKDPFVVVPRPRILVDEGFVAPDQHDIEMGSVGIHSINGRRSTITTVNQERKEADSDSDSDDNSEDDSSGSGSGSNSSSQSNEEDDKSEGSSKGSDQS